MATINDLFEQHLPALLQAEGEKVSASLLSSLDKKSEEKLQLLLSDSSLLAQQCVRALVGSAFILESCCRDPDLLFHWLLVDVPFSSLSAVRIVEMAELSCCDCHTAVDLDKALRVLRRRLMVGIIWRDVNRLSDFAEVCQSMTAMAEVCIQQALDFHYRELSIKHGTPMGAESQLPQTMLVLGMGKLGGAELNVSSDIDLIFAFPESGQTDANRPLDNQQFFTRLGQRVIKSLHETTCDGFVFRVDMRLRPYGQSGALVSSFSALENYYTTQGRDWERFAGIKARVVAGARLVGVDAEQSLLQQRRASDELSGVLQPFVYRRYTDFSVIESLRKLKAMIVQEVRRKGMEGNVKLGAGGIRELEFIVQSFQLISGGREPQLQERHWLSVLAQLEADQVFDENISESLRSAYVFLRHTEHAIQSYQDQQTQQLPYEPQQQAILAWVMGFDGWQAFFDELQGHRHIVSEQFQLVIADAQDPSVQSDASDEWLPLWQHESLDGDDELFVALLKGNQCSQPEAIIRQLEQLRNSWGIRQLSASARESVDLLVPQLLATAMTLEQPDIIILRMLEWLEKIVGRSSYVTFLLENPTVLRLLAVLFQGGVWISDLLGQMPSLLDELLNAESLYTLPSKIELQDELRLRLLRVEPGDIESAMEVLRYFKLAHSLRVAASDLAGSLPLMKISDYLTRIAETVLEQVLILAWDQLSIKHGAPNVDSESDGDECQSVVPGFLIVAYGKLGGIELSYSSDLDLVFIYKADAQGMTHGEKPIDNQTFYTRLGQKIIHILNTRTLSGELYEVDMRLRPSGNSGLLASSITAFSRYQLNDAWTWEHQALVRARPVAGDRVLAQEFDDLRRQVLGQARAHSDLKASVIEMREKMREHLGSSSSAQTKKQKNTEKKPLFHLKQDVGGIVDIEFMVQYAVLAWAYQRPEMMEYTDNIRILERMQLDNCIGEDQIANMIEAYKAYREVAHRLALQKQPSLITEDQFLSYQLPVKRQQVQTLWQQILCSDDMPC